MRQIQRRFRGLKSDIVKTFEMYISIHTNSFVETWITNLKGQSHEKVGEIRA
jgi:hypothetical protein